MRINWRDYTAILAILLVVLVILATILGLPFVQSIDWRPVTVALIFMGFSVYFIIGPSSIPMRGPLFRAATLLGSVAIILAALEMIINNELLFLFIGLDLVVLWSATTIYHVLLRER